MSLFGMQETTALSVNRGRRAYTEKLEDWMKSGTLVMFEGQIGTVVFPISNHNIQMILRRITHLECMQLLLLYDLPQIIRQFCLCAHRKIQILSFSRLLLATPG